MKWRCGMWGGEQRPTLSPGIGRRNWRERAKRSEVHLREYFVGRREPEEWRILILFLLRALERHDLSGCPIWRQLGRERPWSVAFLSTSWCPVGTTVVGRGLRDSSFPKGVGKERSCAASHMPACWGMTWCPSKGWVWRTHPGKPSLCSQSGTGIQRAHGTPVRMRRCSESKEVCQTLANPKRHQILLYQLRSQPRMPAGHTASGRTDEAVDTMLRALGSSFPSKGYLSLYPLPHILTSHMGKEPGKAWNTERSESLSTFS